MELENMKRIFLTVLLAATFLLTGCYGEESSTSDVVTEQTSVSSKDKEPSSSEEVENDTVSTKKTAESSEETAEDEPKDTHELNNKPGESGSNDKSTEKSKDVNSPESKDQSTVESPEPPPQSGTENQPESTVDSFFTKNQTHIIAGIIVVLILLILILAWLIYDRKKLKVKLNNHQNNSPPNMNESNNYTIMPTATVAPGNGQLRVKVGNLKNVGSRREQQDSFCISNIGDKTALSTKGFMAVVADGMGGLEGGAQISDLVTETFLNNYKSQSGFDPATFLYRTAESAELAVEQFMKSKGINGGSTVVAVVVKDSQLNYVSVGDSHIYLLRDNMLKLINREHSFGALLKEKAARGEVDENEPYVNPKRNALTAYIGIGNFNVVDRSEQPIPLRVGDKILLCSDGVYNALGDDAIVAALTGDAVTAARQLEQAVLSQAIPTQDNFTAVILECAQD